MKEMQSSWETGETLLMPDRYDLDGLLAVCNEGRFQIWDKKTEKLVVPITQLMPIKRKFDLPTTFIVNLLYPMNADHFESCVFKLPSNKVWKKIFKMEENCWQKYDLQKDDSYSLRWRFTIPEQLCDYQKVQELKLREGEKYELTFTETTSRSGLGFPLHPELEKIHGDSIWSRCKFYDTDRQMQMWFEFIGESKNIAWYIEVYGTVYRGLDLHTDLKQDTVRPSTNYDLPGYAPARNIYPAFDINPNPKYLLSPLEACIKQVASNCDVNFAIQRTVDPKFAKNIATLGALIMDTDYVYTHKDGLADEKYEPFIFDDKLYINRYYYFNHNKGFDEFVKKLKSFFYKPVAQEQETKQPLDLEDQGNLGKPTRSLISPSQLVLNEKNLMAVQRRIKRLREECLDILRSHPNKVTVEILYYELRAKGVAHTNTVRILYFTSEAERYYEEHGFLEIDYKLGEIREKSKESEEARRDKILNVSHNTLTSQGDFKKFNEKWSVKAEASEAQKSNYIRILAYEHKK